MSDHVRLTPTQYATLCLAINQVPLVGSFAAFQRRLADAVRPFDAGLADVVARLKERQVRTVRSHFERKPKRAACEFSFREWQAVAQAYARIQLRAACPTSLRCGLVAEIGDDEPALAAKLRGLPEGDVASLYRRVTAGKRWCP